MGMAKNISLNRYSFLNDSYYETIALCVTRCVIIDIQAPSFTRVNSLRPQSQCLAITAFWNAPQRTSKTCPLGYRRAVSLYIVSSGTTSFRTQGASSGLIIGTHLLSPKGVALFYLRQMLALLVPLLVGAQSAFVCVFPGFHFGLCPHFTLGYAGVACLRHS